MKLAKRVTYLLPVLAIALTACAGATPSKVADKNSDFYLALPRVVVDIDQAGKPSIAGITPDMVKSLSMGNLDLTQFTVPADYLAWLQSTDTQHVELAFNGDGMFIYANGKQLPYVALSDESVTNLGAVAGTVTSIFAPGYEGYMPLVERFLPLARRLGLNLVIRMPRAEGVAEIPLRDPSAAEAPVNLTAPENSPVQVRIVVTYDDKGVPSIAGISADDLQAMTGYDMTMLKLDPNFVAQLRQKGVQHLSIKSVGDGLALAVNDKPLPTFVCNEDCLKNTAGLVSNLNTFAGMEQINELVTKFGPQLRSVNAELALRFPMAPGSQRIPLPFNTAVN
jgi:hypothetical protein